MEQRYLIVDIDRCWGCKACQVACKYEHGIPAGGGKPVEVMRVEHTEPSGQAACDFLPVACQHCDEPACMEVCPRGAVYRDEEGLVQIDEERCVACGRCVKACPYEAIHSYSEEGRRWVFKCDLCVRRRGMGLPASCEQHCLGGVFTNCTRAEMEKLMGERKYHWSAGRVVYLSDRAASLGKALK